MRKPKLIEDYMRLPYDQVSEFARSVVRQTTTSTFIATGGAVVKPVNDAVVLFDANLAATDNPTEAQRAQRDLLRANVTTALSRLGKFLNLTYPGQEPALLSSGLTMADTAAATTARLVEATDPVMRLTLVDGAPGFLLIKYARPTGSVQNLTRYTTDATLPEENWLVATGGGRERQLGPFPEGTKVWVKAAALAGSTLEPQYSEVKSRLVQ